MDTRHERPTILSDEALRALNEGLAQGSPCVGPMADEGAIAPFQSIGQVLRRMARSYAPNKPD